MTGTMAVGPPRAEGAEVAQVVTPGASAPLPERAIWCIVAGGILFSVVTLLVTHGAAQSFLFDLCSLTAASAAVYGIMRNGPGRRGVWQLVAFGLALWAAGDVVYDVVTRAFGQPDGYPYADVLYLAAYPVLAIALFRLA